MTRKAAKPASTSVKGRSKPFKASGDFFKRTVENAGGVLFQIIFGSTPGSGHYEFISHGIHKLTGLEAENFSEKKYLEMIEEVRPLTPGIPVEPKAQRRAFLAGEIPFFKTEIRLRLPDGSQRWILDSSLPLRDAKSGEIIGAYGILMDIGERVQAQAGFEQKAREMRGLIDSIADRVAIVDMEGKIRDVNQAMVNFHQRRYEEILGRHFLDLVAASDREMLARRFTEAIEKGFSSNVEFKSRSSDGVEVDSEVNALVIRDGNGRPLEAVAVIRDISLRKAMEMKLAESEEMYRSLIENIQEAVFMLDESGIIRFISAGIERISGYKPEALIGRNFSEFIFQDDLVYIMSQFGKLARNILAPDEYRIIGKGGEIRWISSSSRPIFENNRFCGVHGILADIHERKIAQQTLQRQQEQLQQAQKMEAIGTMAGGMAHDFNNLLMGIQGRASLMLMESEIGHPHYEHLIGIEQYIKSAAELTRQLLGLARGGKYEVVPSDLNALIQNGIQMFGRTKKEIKIYSKFDPSLWVVEIDRTQIEQVLLNLLVNAWQAMPEGGEISVLTQNVELLAGDARVFHVPPGRYVMVGVSDSGIGMDGETLSRIFDPFFTTKEMGRGTGLGLASAYGIVKNHGGVITVYSEMGSGSTFHVYLPASTKKVLAVKKEMATDVNGGNETILLIDDEEMILEVAEQLLSNLGYKVLKASSGASALELFRRDHEGIDLVILDMIMPQMSGGRVFDSLRKIDPQVRVLLSSGYSINGQAMEILRRGCRGFIQKPFTVKEMARKVREILEAPS